MFPDLEPGDYFDGRMPNVLKRLSLDQLSGLAGLMNNWHQYIVSKRSLEAVRKTEATRQRKFILSMVRSQYKDSGDASSDKEAEERANQDFRFITADAALAKIEIIYMKTMTQHIRRKLPRLRQGARGRPSVGQVGRGPSSKGEGIELTFELPPSTNKLYQARRGSGLSLTTAAKKYNEGVKRVMSDNIAILGDLPVGPELVYQFSLTLYFEMLENPGWFERWETNKYYTKDITPKGRRSPLHRKGDIKHKAEVRRRLQKRAVDFR